MVYFLYHNNDLTASDHTKFEFTYESINRRYGYKNASGVFVPFEDSSDATATASEILSGYTAYVGGQKLTGTASAGGLADYSTGVHWCYINLKTDRSQSINFKKEDGATYYTAYMNLVDISINGMIFEGINSLTDVLTIENGEGSPAPIHVLIYNYSTGQNIFDRDIIMQGYSRTTFTITGDLSMYRMIISRNDSTGYGMNLRASYKISSMKLDDGTVIKS